MISRRDLLSLGALGGAVGLLAPDASGAIEAATKTRHPYRPVHTLNGWTLPYRLRDGVKEFHLVAEEFEHEFAPGSRAK